MVAEGGHGVVRREGHMKNANAPATSAPCSSYPLANKRANIRVAAIHPQEDMAGGGGHVVQLDDVGVGDGLQNANLCDGGAARR